MGKAEFWARRGLPWYLDGLSDRDGVYAEFWLRVALESGEQRVASWLVRDVPEGSGQWRSSNAVTGNLILTNQRVLWEPYQPGKAEEGDDDYRRGQILNLITAISTRGQRFEPGAIALSSISSARALPRGTGGRRGIGAPMKIVTGSDQLILTVLGRFFAPIPMRVDRDDQARADAVAKIAAAARSEANPGQP